MAASGMLHLTKFTQNNILSTFFWSWKFISQKDISCAEKGKENE
jgi:hypothetical protein